MRTQTAEITQMRTGDAALAKAGAKRGDLGVAHGRAWQHKI
jgi:hypothetical protein